MSESTKWTLEFDTGKFTGPAVEGANAVNQFNITLNQAKQSLTNLEAASHGLNVAGAFMKAASVVSGIVSGIGSAVVGFAEMAIDAAAFKEETLAGFTAVYQSADVAVGLFDHALQVAKLTKFETKDVVDLYNRLAVGGFGLNEIDTLSAGIADVQSALGSVKGEQLTNAFIKIRTEGRATWDSLMEMVRGGAGSATVGNLGKALGIKEDDFGKLTKKIQKAIQDGKVSDNMLINAGLESIQAKLNPGGKLGDYAIKQSETLTGLISTAKSSFGDLVMGMSFDKLPGLQNFKDFLKTATGMLDTGSESGKRLQEIIGNLINDVFSIFDISPDSAKKSFAGILDIAETLEKKVKGVAKFIKDDMIPGLMEAFNTDGGIMEKLKVGLVAVMKVAGGGLLIGLLSAAGRDSWAAEVENKVFGKKEAPKADGQPSWVPDGMVDATAYDGAPGYGPAADKKATPDGRRALGGNVERGRSYLVGEHGPELFVPRSGGEIIPNGGAGGDVSVTVNVFPSAGMDEQELAQMVAAQVAQTLRDIGRHSRYPGKASV